MARYMIMLVMALALVPLVLSACESGERVTWFESTGDQGRWRMDGTLIRSYDVSLTEAYDTITAFAKEKGWNITRQTSSAREAEVIALTDTGVKVGFQVWAPRGRATEIGVEYAGGNRIESVRLLDELESDLPGDRIGAGASS